MPFNGSGVYVTTNPPPFVFNTVISETQMNAALTDFASALSSVLVRDGQAAMTGSLNMGLQSVYNLGVGSAGSPSLRWTAGNGFYNPSADVVSLALGGTPVATFSTGGFTVSGVVVGLKNSQTTYSTAAVQSVSNTGDVHVGLQAAGSSAVSIRHARGGSGILIVAEDGTTLAPVVASATTANAGNFGGTGTEWVVANHLRNPGNTQPSFREINSATTTASSTILTAWTEGYDQGSHFNHTTGVFVAPINGVYIFALDWQCSLSGNGQVEVQIKNTTSGAVFGHGEYTNTSATGIIKQGAVVGIGRLSANDTVVVQSGTITNGTLYGNAFSGHLLG